MAAIFALAFLAVFLTTIAVLSVPFSSRARVRHSLDQLSAYEIVDESEGIDIPFADRIVWPLLERVGRITRRWTSSERLEKTRHNLALAGVRHLSAEKFMSIKLGFAAAGVGTYLLLIFPWLIFGGRPLWLGLPLIALPYLLPEAWLQRRIESRQRQIGATLADSIDILTIGIEAGLVFDSALTKVVKNMDGPLSEELGRLLGELQIGVSRREALRNLGNRTTVPELQNFCATLVQADTLGISISKILRTEANELRTRRRQSAEEQAMKTPVKLVFPIILCILPALMVVILGPGIIRIAGTLLKTF